MVRITLDEYSEKCSRLLDSKNIIKKVQEDIALLSRFSKSPIRPSKNETIKRKLDEVSKLIQEIKDNLED